MTYFVGDYLNNGRYLIPTYEQMLLEKDTYTIKNLQEKLDILLLFVTHDIHSIKEICTNLVIIKDGLVIESGKTKQILEKPKSSYTKQLLASTFENKDFRK